MSEMTSLPKGAPTFEEYVENRDKYQGKDQLFESVQNGGIIFKRGMRKILYFIQGYRCATLSEVERIASDMGYGSKDLETKTELRDVGNGKWDAHVTFWPKEVLKKRESWG